MRTITEIKIGIFLDKYKNYLLRKTNIYDKYFLNGEVDTDSIINLSNNELYELEQNLDNEKTYLKGKS